MGRRMFVVLVAAMATWLTSTGTGAALSLPPIASTTTGEMADPSVVIDGSRYVVFASATRAAPDERLIPTMTAGDLGALVQGGDALSKAPWWSDGHDIWAPAAGWLGGSWRLYFSARHAVTGRHCIAVASAAVVTGPFDDGNADPLICRPDLGDVIDAEPFVDADGSTWLLWKSSAAETDRRPALWVQPLTPDGRTMGGPPARLLEGELPWEQPVIESPSMVRWGGKHLLFYSAGTFVDERYAIGYALCDGVLGPCRRASDRPLLASGGDLVGPGGQAAFIDRDGRLRLVFHSWARGDHGNIRVLRLAWLVGPPQRLSVVRGPIGHIDSVTRAAGRVLVKGWAIDPAAASAAVVRVGGVTQSATLLAADVRADVDAAYPGFGPSGFTASIPSTGLGDRICVDTPHGRIGCAPVPR